MKKTDKFWVDEHYNKWSTLEYTEEEAAEAAKTLTDCFYCTDCKNCTKCTKCTKCTNCFDCCACESCRGCNDCMCCDLCRKCNQCRFCVECACCKACRYCNQCEYCAKCRDCSYIERFEENPQRIVGTKMGSRNAHPVVYWVTPGYEYCVIGCFRGTLTELESRVKETYEDPENEHRSAYLKFIAAVRSYQEASM